MDIAKLQRKAKEIRKQIIECVYRSQYGYLGANLSCVEILTYLYYGGVGSRPLLRLDAKKPGWDKQDYFILSKVEAALAQYVVLSDKGFFSKEELMYYAKGGLLKFSPHRKIPGVVCTADQSGDALAFATGLAASLKREKADNKVYVMCGDYELQRGVFWESLLLAAQMKCDNLVLIIDNANLQCDGFIKGVRDVSPIQDKIESFGVKVVQILDGHDYEEIAHAMAKVSKIKGKPVCLWAHTVSGYGIPFAENKPSYFASQLSENEFKEAHNVLRDF